MPHFSRSFTVKELGRLMTARPSALPVRALLHCGYGEISTCDAMRPLHTYPIFAAPRSPVTTFETSCIRCEPHVAEHLAATSLRINVPADDGPHGRAYIDTAINMLDRALNSLASPPCRATLPT